MLFLNHQLKRKYNYKIKIANQELLNENIII